MSPDEKRLREAVAHAIRLLELVTTRGESPPEEKDRRCCKAELLLRRAMMPALPADMLAYEEPKP